MLPDLPGAAPIHHALLNRRTRTGVTVQTLHPTKFDQGVRLAQTKYRGLGIPKDATPESLKEMLGEHGAGLLIHIIREGLFADPEKHKLEDFSQRQILRLTDQKGVAKAPKIRPADSKIDFEAETAEDILLKLRVFGQVWDTQVYNRLLPGVYRRIVYTDISPPDAEPRDNADEGFLVGCRDWQELVIRKCTIEGERKDQGVRTLRRLFQASDLESS
jgi:methionyl-tRNA formyltransferase